MPLWALSSCWSLDHASKESDEVRVLPLMQDPATSTKTSEMRGNGGTCAIHHRVISGKSSRVSNGYRDRMIQCLYTSKYGYPNRTTYLTTTLLYLVLKTYHVAHSDFILRFTHTSTTRCIMARARVKGSWTWVPSAWEVSAKNRLDSSSKSSEASIRSIVMTSTCHIV